MRKSMEASGGSAIGPPVSVAKKLNMHNLSHDVDILFLCSFRMYVKSTRKTQNR